MLPWIFEILLKTRNFALGFCIAMSLLAVPLFGKTIHVPVDQPTIQAGINAASNGDTVLVAPGTYYENINFNGKAITVKSSGGNKVTIIDGSHLASVVTFSSGETLKSLLAGFTLQNGSSSAGGGVVINSASPTVRNNVIQSNSATEGAGIVVESGSPTIWNNVIQSNVGYSGGGGIGLISASPLIQGNVIQTTSCMVAREQWGVPASACGEPVRHRSLATLFRRTRGFRIPTARR